MQCTRCVERVDHCHGTLIVHVSGEFECTDTECRDEDQARHPLVIDCATVEGACACTTDLVAEADDTAPTDAPEANAPETDAATQTDPAELLAVG